MARRGRKPRIRVIGIYRIVCSGNGKTYIGSSVDILKRWRIHARQLRANRHHSLHLQRSYNKYGPRSFVFSVLETVALRSGLLAAEQRWIDKLSPKFNTLSVVDNHKAHAAYFLFVAQKADGIARGREAKYQQEQLERQRVSWLHHFGQQK